MSVVQVLLLGWVAYAAIKSPAKWVIIAALVVSYWFPQIGQAIDGVIDMAVDLVQTSVGRL